MAGFYYIDVTPEVILWALDRAPEDRVDEKTRLRALSWVSGEKKPTFNQLSAFSKKTCVPIGSLFSKELPKEDFEILECRAFGDSAIKPSRALIDIIVNMEIALDYRKDYMDFEEFDSLSFVGSAKETDDVMATAGKIRGYLELDNDWAARFKDAESAFRFLKKKTDRHDILVMTSEVANEDYTRPLDPEEFRAFSIADELAPLIFVNENDVDELKLFSLLHEIVHVWLGKSDLFDWDGNMPANKDMNGISETERFCFLVAAELLFPESSFLKTWNETDGILREKIETACRKFNCDTSLVAVRALDDGLVGEAEYDEIVKCMERKPHVFKRKRKGCAAYYDLRRLELSGSLLTALCIGILEGFVTYTDAYRVTYAWGNHFDEILKRFPDDEVDGWLLERI